MRALDLFCGAGGVTAGLLAVGLDVVAAVDKWPVACEAHRRWHPGVPVVKAGVSDVAQVGWPAILSVDLIWASPSCKPWSMANRTPKRGTAHPEYFDLCELVRMREAFGARWLVIENVMGLAWSKEGAREMEMLKRYCHDLGLYCYPNQIASNSLGIEQERRRLIVVIGPEPVRIPNGSDWIPPARCVREEQGELFGVEGECSPATPGVAHGAMSRPGSGGHHGSKTFAQRKREARTTKPAPMAREGSKGSWERETRWPKQAGRATMASETKGKHGWSPGGKRVAGGAVEAGESLGRARTRDGETTAEGRDLAECCRLQMVPMAILDGLSKKDAHALVGNCVPPILAEHVARHVMAADRAGAAQDGRGVDPQTEA